MESKKPVVNSGPTKEVWDAALKRSNLDPSKVAEYNVVEELEQGESPDNQGTAHA